MFLGSRCQEREQEQRESCQTTDTASLVTTPERSADASYTNTPARHLLLYTVCDCSDCGQLPKQLRGIRGSGAPCSRC